jgi:molecular chaperone IbpA
LEVVADRDHLLNQPGRKAGINRRNASKEITVMTTFDFSPLYRNSIGFDRLASLLASAQRVEQGGGYPPYNIVSEDENRYRITMAVAGFAQDDLDITSEQNTLTVTGKRNDEEDGSSERFLHRGIANRAFERRFNLADHVRVTGASLENGLLHIDLEREIPEAMKPRKIEIGASNARLIDVNKDEATAEEHKAA